MCLIVTGKFHSILRPIIWEKKLKNSKIGISLVLTTYKFRQRVKIGDTIINWYLVWTIVKFRVEESVFMTNFGGDQ